MEPETIKLPQFKSEKKLFKFLKANKSTLIRQKKAILKWGDGYIYAGSPGYEKGDAQKAERLNVDGVNEIKVLAIINTTNWLDSHKDVHLPGIWDKSLKENKNGMHVQEHKSREFEKIISDGTDLKAFAKKYKWRELGYNADGETQALVFESIVKRERNAYMFKQYANGYVKNHSVGMRYVRIKLCINSIDYPEEYAEWQKYYSEIINKEDADNTGYFWAVLEAKYIEGSAVPMGSNIITPTQEISMKNKSTAPSEDTPGKGRAAKAPDTTGDSQNKGFFNNLI